MEIVEEEATQTETFLENSRMPPLLKKSPSQSSPPVDAPNAPDSPPPDVLEDASDSSCLASVGNLPEDIRTATKDKIFGVYQDCVHQNPGKHLYGEIEEGGKCKER